MSDTTTRRGTTCITQDVDEFVLVHLFPREPGYRLSGCDVPVPGDVARCGWVKRSVHDPSLRISDVNCVVCHDLSPYT